MTLYRQVTRRLRWSNGPGLGERVSERPFEPGRRGQPGRYLDSDEEPTLVEIGPEDVLDVARLLKSGAIQPYEPTAPPSDCSAEESPDG